MISLLLTITLWLLSSQAFATFGEAGDDVYTSDDHFMVNLSLEDPGAAAFFMGELYSSGEPGIPIPWFRFFPFYPKYVDRPLAIIDKQLKPSLLYPRLNDFAYRQFAQAMAESFSNQVIQEGVRRDIRSIVIGMDHEIRFQPAGLKYCPQSTGHQWHVDGGFISLISRADLQGSPTEYASYPGTYDSLTFSSIYQLCNTAGIKVKTSQSLTSIHFARRALMAGCIPAPHRGPPKGGGKPRAIISTLGLSENHILAQLFILRLVDQVETDPNTVAVHVRFLTQRRYRSQLVEFMRHHLCHCDSSVQAYRDAFNRIIMAAPRAFSHAIEDNPALKQCVRILFDIH